MREREKKEEKWRKFFIKMIIILVTFLYTQVFIYSHKKYILTTIFAFFVIRARALSTYLFLFNFEIIAFLPINTSHLK